MLLLPLLQVWVTPSGLVLCADERFRDWFGVPSKELVGRSISSLSTDIEGFDRCGCWGSGIRVWGRWRTADLYSDKTHCATCCTAPVVALCHSSWLG
jgi:hypothetical protein